MNAPHQNGGDLVAAVLERQGVPFLFTLCGGHISPILVGARRRGIRVIDVRHEASAVFAADAAARLTGRPGVAAVTAGPGATNAVTAVKNAQLAQSPVVVIGGATATALKGRGALQDIDQRALYRPHVKRVLSVARVRDLVPALEDAFRVAQDGVPGPVLVECPLDVLYPEVLVRGFYGLAGEGSRGAGIADRVQHAYVRRHLERLFEGADQARPSGVITPSVAPVTEGDVERVATRLRGAERPVLLVGSQALLRAHAAEELAGAVVALGVPVYLAGSARGLLRGDHPLLLRHRRREALREADVVLLAGVPCDFRLEYGRQIHRDATVLAVNRSRRELFRNRRPAVGVVGDPGELLLRLAVGWPESPDRWTEWRERLGERDRERDAEIRRMAAEPTAFINPLTLCIAIERAAAEEATVVLDGGDFAATASYVVSARRPLGSLDPGPFGTLGVGAGFALAARLCRPDAEVWLLYGDGSAAFSLAEFDTFVRHQLPVIAIVGNDACWTQIARGQRDMLGDDVGTTLRHTDYHVVAEGYGGRGLKVDRAEDLDGVLAEAKRLAGSGVPVLVNALMGETSFRKGAIAI